MSGRVVDRHATRATGSGEPVPALRGRAVVKSFGATPVLRQASLDVPAGSVVALLGPSGCGKTTFVRVVAGFDPLDAGSVELAGRLVARGGAAAPVHIPPERRRVGVVPQEGALFSHLDVAGNVGFGLPGRGRTPQDRSRVADLLDLVGLGGLGARRPDQLSGGQQQRVAVARALAGRPDLVCLDEPFSALDAGLRGTVRAAVVAALRAEAASVVLVTHDQDEALSVADLIAVMLDGRIAQVGTPDEVYRRPTSIEVGQFLGESVILPGRVSAGSVECALGRLPLASGLGAAAWAAGSGGAPATVLLRPEQLVPEACQPGDPRAGAEVVALSFHGHDALVVLRIETGVVVQARVLGGLIPHRGDRVALTIRGEAWAIPG